MSGGLSSDAEVRFFNEFEASVSKVAVAGVCSFLSFLTVVRVFIDDKSCTVPFASRADLFAVRSFFGYSLKTSLRKSLAKPLVKRSARVRSCKYFTCEVDDENAWNVVVKGTRLLHPKKS